MHALLLRDITERIDNHTALHEFELGVVGVLTADQNRERLVSSVVVHTQGSAPERSDQKGV